MKVLLVDDNPIELEIIREILENTREDIELSNNLGSITEFSPDLIILDLYMPNKSGYDICLSLKSNPTMCDIPIVILSGSNSIEDKVKCFNAGALDYIEKPITREILIKTIIKYARIGRIYKAGAKITLMNKTT